MPEKVQKGPNNFRHFLLLLSLFTLNSKKNLLMSFFSSGLAPLSPPNTVLLRRGLLVLNELKNIWKCQQIYFANLYFWTIYFWNIYFWNIYFGDICFGKEKTRRIYIKFLETLVAAIRASRGSHIQLQVSELFETCCWHLC